MPENDAQTTLPAREDKQTDAFFILRDARELLLRRLGELAYLANIGNKAIIEAFCRSLGETYDKLAAGTEQHGFGETAGLTASRISLVGNDDLELEIRIGEIIHRLKGNNRIDHWRVQLRLMSLLHRPAMTADNNPAGLSTLDQGLWAICDAIEGNLDKKLDALDRLEEQLQHQLADVYAEINALLEDRQVELAHAPLVVRPSAANARAALAAGHTPLPEPPPVHRPSPDPANPLVALQQAVGQRSGFVAQGGAASPFTAAPDGSFPSLSPAFGGLQGAPGPGASGGSFSAESALNASAQAMLTQLMNRLHTLESQHDSNTPLRSQDLGQPLTSPASVVLDTLAMIFEGIFAAPELPDAIKTAIGRLQIPLIRIAIADASFFTDSAHPARQLINRMAYAALGLSQDSGRDHPLCAALIHFADQVRQSLESEEGSIANLAPHLSTLEALIAERESALDAAARPYLALVNTRETEEEAHRASTAWLRDALATQPSPSIGTFFVNYWRRVMREAYVADTRAGPHWHEAAETATDLAWSVRPKTSPEERQKLAALIPSLLRRLNAGLDTLGTPPAERTPFLDACFALQTAVLRNRAPLDSATPTALPPEPLAPPADTPLILQHQGKLVQYFPGPASAINGTLKPAEWLRFTLPDGEVLCGRYVGSTTRRTHSILHNSEWGYAVALPAPALEQQLRDARAHRLAETALFDRAATAALDQLPGR